MEDIADRNIALSPGRVLRSRAFYRPHALGDQLSNNIHPLPTPPPHISSPLSIYHPFKQPQSHSTESSDPDRHTHTYLHHHPTLYHLQRCPTPRILDLPSKNPRLPFQLYPHSNQRLHLYLCNALPIVPPGRPSSKDVHIRPCCRYSAHTCGHQGQSFQSGGGDIRRDVEV